MTTSRMRSLPARGDPFTEDKCAILSLPTSEAVVGVKCSFFCCFFFSVVFSRVLVVCVFVVVVTLLYGFDWQGVVVDFGVVRRDLCYAGCVTL